MTVEPKTQVNVRQAVPFFSVDNMPASIHFYVDGLGFKITKQWVDGSKLRWCWIELGDAALMLQEFAKEGHDSWTPQGKVGEGVTICFQCADALALYHQFAQHGLHPSNPRVSNGLWETHLSDPDGYALSFESPTDAPEDTSYSQPVQP